MVFFLQKIVNQEEIASSKNYLMKQESFGSSRFSDNDDENDAISSSPHDSFDSINSPLRIVQECMRRLQLQQDFRDREQQILDDSNGQDSGQDSSSKDDNLVDKQNDEVQNEITEPCDIVNELENDADLVNELVNCLKTVALDWQSLRNARECKTCQTAFNSSTQRYHCWGCGKLYCLRCIKKKMVLPGHKYSYEFQDENHEKNIAKSDSEMSLEDNISSKWPLFDNHLSAQRVPVCLECFKSITFGNSVEYNN